MAQPMRSKGWRPLTRRSKARGTSGSSPGKLSGDLFRWRADGIGGAPDHHAAELIELRGGQPRRALRRGCKQQMRARRAERNQRRKPGVAGQPPAAAGWCGVRNFRRRSGRCRAPATRSAPRLRRTTAGSTHRDDRQRRRHDRDRPRPCAATVAAAATAGRRVATTTARPDSNSAMAAPPTTRSWPYSAANKLPSNAGASAKK